MKTPKNFFPNFPFYENQFSHTIHNCLAHTKFKITELFFSFFRVFIILLNEFIKKNIKFL